MMELQNQIYIVSGVLGGISILLIITTFVLMSRVSRSKKDIAKLKVDIQKNRSLALSGASQPKAEISYPIPASLPTPQSAVYNSASPPVTSAAPLLQANRPGNYGQGYNYDNSISVERERDLTAGGVRVLPSLYKPTDARKPNYDTNSGHY